MTQPQDTQMHFHQELDSLEQKVLSMVERAEQMVDMAVTAVTESDLDLARNVVDLDKVIDETHLEVYREWTSLMARHEPLGSDLRKLTVLLQLNHTFERMGDQSVNIARVAILNEGLPRVDAICDQVREMCDLVRPMIRTAVEAYVRKDIEQARLLPAMDQPIDRLNANMYKETVAVGSDLGLLEWATKMLLVSRALERVGDQAVDFAEQTVFLVTGDRPAFDEEPAGDQVSDGPD